MSFSILFFCASFLLIFAPSAVAQRTCIDVQTVDILPGSGGSFPSRFTGVGDKVFFSAFNGFGIGQELNIYDCSAPVGMEWNSVDINLGGDSSSPSGFTAVGDKVFFRARSATVGSELYIYDCSAPAGMELYLVDINPGTNGSSPSDFAVVGDKVFFRAFGSTVGSELHIYDCSAPVGMELEVVDINPDSNSSTPRDFTAVGDKVFFRATTATSGLELYIYDCSAPAGMELDFVDIRPGSSSSVPLEITAVGDKVFFSAIGATVGSELYIYDCSADPGKELEVVDIDPNSSSFPGAFTAVGDKVFFQARGAVTAGFELYIYDCSAPAGMELEVVDINPGSNSSSPSGFTAVGDKVFFSAIGATVGSELYIYDCSADPGKELEVVDINPNGSSFGGLLDPEIIAVDDKVFFRAFDPTVGRELHIANCFSEDDTVFSYPTDACLGDTNPTATITGITGGNFSVDNGATIDQVTGELDLSTTSEGATYTVTYTSNNISTCGPFEQMITVHGLPQISGMSSVCAGATISLMGTGTLAAVTPWTSGTPEVATVDNGGVVTGVRAGTTLITYTDSNGCMDTMTVTVFDCLDGMDVLSITDPCNCSNPNNIELPDGRFIFNDTLRVMSSTSPVTLSATDDFLLDDQGDAIPLNTVFTLNTTTGMYELVVYTVADQSSSIMISNGVSAVPFVVGPCAVCIVIPTMGEWGVMCLSLLLMIMEVVVMRQREFAY